MRSIRIDVPLAMTAEKVWAALADPAARREWFGGEYAIEPHEGGAVRIDLGDEDVHATGVVRSYGPPHVIEHTFVDDAAPDITSVCVWGVTRTTDGAVLSFEQNGMSTAQHDALGPTWSRLLGARPTGAGDDRAHTSLADAMTLLARAKRVLLVSYITEETPRALVRAGLAVLVKSGPGPDQWSVARMDGDALAFDPRTEPLRPVDIVHLDVPALFDEYLNVAIELGASTFWVHSGRTHPATPHDRQGTWLPDDVSAELRSKTEARGLTYVDDVFIVDAARRLAGDRRKDDA